MKEFIEKWLEYKKILINKGIYHSPHLSFEYFIHWISTNEIGIDTGYSNED